MLWLQEQLDAHIAGHPSFIRLSDRSPKDAALHHPEFRRLYRVFLAILLRSCSSLMPRRSIFMLACLRAVAAQLCVTDGAQALKLLGYSERVFGYLTATNLQRAAGGSAPHVGVIVRPFSWHLLPEWEFRVFICEGEVTAISQYNPIQIPLLQQNKGALQEQIMAFLATLVPKITPRFPSCVVDIGACGPSSWEPLCWADASEGHVDYFPATAAALSELRWTLIELNAFSRRTNACLFDWDQDGCVLTGVTKRSPLPFRVYNRTGALPADMLHDAGPAVPRMFADHWFSLLVLTVAVVLGISILWACNSE